MAEQAARHAAEQRRDALEAELAALGSRHAEELTESLSALPPGARVEYNLEPVLRHE